MTQMTEAVEADLAKLPDYIQNGTLASLARTIAGKLDSGRVGVRDLSSLSRELRLILAELAQHRAAEDDDGDRLLADLASVGM